MRTRKAPGATDDLAVSPTASAGGALTILLILSVFGPYVYQGLRVEQLVVYSSVVVLLPMSIRRIDLKNRAGFLISWLALVLVSLLGVVFPTRLPLPWGLGSTFAGLDNLLLPLAVMALVWSIVRREDAIALIGTAARVLVSCMFVNALLALISTRVNVQPILRVFWAAEGDTESVAERAAALGRYSGIFNHPAEAGVLYGLAGLGAVYLWRNRDLKVAGILAVLVLGGLLTVSKIFILGGIPLILLYWWRSRKAGGKLSVVVMVVISGLAIVQSGLLDRWLGADYLLRLLVPTKADDALSLYTAGRFGEDSGLAVVANEILTSSPLVGVGAGGLAVAYDNGWIEALVVAGVIGAGLFTIVLIRLLLLPRHIESVHLRRFAFFFAVLLIGGALGVPVLTANRVATVVWVFIALLTLAAANSITPALRATGEGGTPRKFDERGAVLDRSARGRL